jgi:ATP-dependent Zn protease
LKPLLPFILAIFVFVGSVMRRTAVKPPPLELSYGAFMSLVSSKPGSISELRLALSRYSFLLDGRPAFTRPVRVPTDVMWFLHKSGIDFRAAATSGLASIMPLLFPFLWLGAVYSMMRRQMNGATGNVGKKASSLRLSATDLTFEDVAGVGALVPPCHRATRHHRLAT